MSVRLLLFSTLPLLTGLLLVRAQAGEIIDAPTFKIDAPVVLIPTTVTDRRGALVSGLPSRAFLVSQDNVPQHITSFGEQDVPVSIGIVFDTSESMRRELAQAKDVLRAFLEVANPDD